MSEPATKKAKIDYDGPDLELKCINTIRAVSADQPQAANSGHPGAPMGCAPMAHLLWNEVMNYSPSDPKWMNKDRFVWSNGHACALQYTMLHMAGYNLSVDDLKQFRKLHSKTPGHPESFVTDGKLEGPKEESGTENHKDTRYIVRVISQDWNWKDRQFHARTLPVHRF